jgi:tripartite-type tricarboxylate transporter receptor subunit TctC
MRSASDSSGKQLGDVAGDGFLPGVALVAPARPVRIIVGVGPGRAIDILARLVGQWLYRRVLRVTV